MQRMDKKGETCAVSGGSRAKKNSDVTAKDAEKEAVCEYSRKQCNRSDSAGGVHHASFAIVNKAKSNRTASPNVMLTSNANKSNEVSFMQESSDFQWCLEEEEYQRSLISSKNTPRNHVNGANNYEVISRNIDANLAEIDMETFKSEDIHAILTLPTIISRESVPVQQQGGEEFASVSDSLLQEIESYYNSQVSCESFGDLSKNEPLFSPRKERDIKNGQSSSHCNRVTDLSVDSLDMSLEENTNEVVMRCVEQDKTKYTIAFEESLSSLTFTDSNGDDERKTNEIGGPRSLIRLFIRNRVSPTTSAETSASISFESHSQESGAGGSASSTSTPTKGYTNSIGLQAIEETNNNRRLDNRNDVTTKRDNEDDNVFEDSLIMDEASTLLPPQKCAFNRLKASPIKEEDEPLTDSSRADVTMRSDTETDVPTVYQKDECRMHLNDTSKTHHSTTENRNIHRQQDRTNRHSFDGFVGCNANRNVRIGYSKESSSSSGYGSSRHGSTEWLRKNYGSPVKNRSDSNASFTTMRTASTQVPVHIQDKQVQTSLSASKSMDFVLKEKADPITEERTSNKKPFYVCYPNYSLPDLSFLGDLASKSSAKGSKVILSPTKFKLPIREAASSRMRTPVTNKGVRPKSCTDYENLTKQSFSHIKDWDSLKVLLPNEFKALIERIKGVNDDRSSLSTRHPGVRFRSTQKRAPRKPTVTANSEETAEKNCGCTKNKRHSLQEPFDAEVPQCPVTACVSGITLTATPQAVKEATVDELSEMISMDMTPKEVTNIIGGHSNKLLSPTLVCEPICEQNEDCSTCSTFRELREHWEAIATSPGNAPKYSVLSTAPVNRSPDRKENKFDRKLENSQAAVRSKPKIPEKPLHCIKKPPQQSGSRPALRPSTLNTQNFKSMIPVAKGSKSPPAKWSPTTLSHQSN
ncbi:hypothetical protein B4U80_06905 [Leptotrombidium deliense]|uniref:Uncharacterized protein n=1 Tax=Leptotrombidium deliense TaxID=299467 RepID=A0A443SVJ2_9ACAR|nr:hypothetical protein B4U80_06905 [Leptotrombidium deliense]